MWKPDDSNTGSEVPVSERGDPWADFEDRLELGGVSWKPVHRFAVEVDDVGDDDRTRRPPR